MAVTFILPASSAAFRRNPAQARDRLGRLHAIDPEHREMALIFLAAQGVDLPVLVRPSWYFENV
jgi:hypothetical protein